MGNLRSVPIVEKHNLHDVSIINGVSAISSMEGWRKTMEDAHILINMKDYAIIGIFDGHGNDICAKFCQDNFLKLFEIELAHITTSTPTPEDFKRVLTETFKKLDEEFKKIATNGFLNSRAYDSGTTALVTVITDSYYIIANAGDSRGLIIDKTLKRIKFATLDHKPNNKIEKQRIEKSGHKVQSNRIDGNLAVSRGIGDFEYKNKNFTHEECAVTCIPDVTIIQKEFNTLLILACDGIWDVLSNESVLEYLLRLKKHTFTQSIKFNAGTVCTIDKYYQLLTETSLSSDLDSNPIKNLCENLINIAFDRGSKDNFTVAIYNC